MWMHYIVRTSKGTYLSDGPSENNSKFTRDQSLACTANTISQAKEMADEILPGWRVSICYIGLHGSQYTRREGTTYEILSKHDYQNDDLRFCE